MPNYDFDVLVHGKSVTKYVHEGHVYIEGRKGSEFTILVRNRTGSRVLAVITVDGLSIMDGKPGSIEGTGYVLDPFETLKIPGWRLNNDDVAKFVFGKKGKSYASKKGTPADVGVIGCAIFEEEGPTISITSWPGVTVVPCSYDVNVRGTGSPPASHVYYTSTTSDVTCDCATINNVTTSSCTIPSQSKVEEKTAGEVQPVQNLGTEFGERARCASTEVTFDRKSSPAETFVVHYDDRAGLKARGIDLDRKVRVANPFPKDEQKGCEPPAGWRG